MLLLFYPPSEAISSARALRKSEHEHVLEKAGGKHKKGVRITI